MPYDKEKQREKMRKWRAARTAEQRELDRARQREYNARHQEKTRTIKLVRKPGRLAMICGWNGF